MASPRMAGPEVVPLDRVSIEALGELVAREQRAWRDILGWESPASPQTVTRAIEWGVVRGAALAASGCPVGYLLLQPGQSETRLCGVHLPSDAAAAAAAAALVGHAVAQAPPASRIEGQLLAFEAQDQLDAAFRRFGFTVEPRDFLEIRGLAGRAGASRPLSDAGVLARAARIRPLEPEDLAECASVLVAAHRGGVEARINQAFRSEEAAFAYLREVVEAGGCGRVRAEASSVAWSGARVAGFCVATTTSPGVGHVPQIALAPAAQGQGLGALLLERALEAFAADGCHRVTLSVSRANGRASAWYRRLGFRRLLPFASYHRDASA